MVKKILITGGCGFTGSHFVEHWLKQSDAQLIVLDNLDYASAGFDRLRDIKCYDSKRVLKLTADINQPLPVGVKQEIGDVDYILHLGAQTHVDNSIIDPYPFVLTNVVGTMRLLDFAREQRNLKRFVYFSTDEVFGPAPDGVNFKEWDRYNCTNPYSAAKAGGEELALSYANCYKVPVIVTHCMNIYGERQHPEKYIPLCIKKILSGDKILIHGYPDGKRAGSRFYIHARNVAHAVDFLIKESKVRDKYNIVGEKEVDNLTLARFIADIVGKPLNYEIVDFHTSRPGHDVRYALDGTKMNAMGWKLPLTFEKSLEKTVRWYLKDENKKWLAL